MSKWVSMLRTLESITRWSLTVKVGGTIIGVFWFLQLIKDELLPERWEERLRLLNLLPHWPWYEWTIALLLVFLVGTIEGVIRWNGNEMAPILGWPGTLQNNSFMVAGKMRDFVQKFKADNGEVPRMYPTSDSSQQMRISAAISEWCTLFTRQFRVTLSDEVEDILNKIQAEGIPLDFTIVGVLEQPTLTPNSLLLVAGQLMAGGLSLTLKK
jgi:hypothetical protein